MSARKLKPLCVALGLLTPGCPRNWEHDVVDSAPFATDDDAWWRMRCTSQALQQAGPAWQEARALHMHCARAIRPEDRALCNTPLDDREAIPVDPWTLRPLLSFVHLSDAQIKDPRVHLHGFIGSDVSYDNLQSASRRDELLERHAPAVLLATVLGIDKLVTDAATSQEPPCKAPCFRQPLAPSFMMHTGDAVDAGMLSELYQFVGALDQAPIPWFDVLGNHDNMLFGTFTELIAPDPAPGPPLVPIGTTERFMRYHRPDSWTAPEAKLSRAHPDHMATVTPPSQLTSGGSYYHGFDFACDTRRGALCSGAKGHYAFQVELPRRRPPPGAPTSPASASSAVPRSLRIVVLDTAETPDDWSGSDGTMQAGQIEWLRSELKTAEASHSYVLVFGHHNLESFDADERGREIQDALKGSRRVLAYVTGHTHVDGFKVWPRGDDGDDEEGPPLWEIIGGSTLVYPQLGRIIELMEEESSGRIYLRVVTMRQALGDRADLMRSVTGDLTGCPTPPGDDCSRAGYRGESLCQGLADRAFLGRAGAHRDHDDDLRDEWEAVTKTNGTMLVYDPKTDKAGSP